MLPAIASAAISPARLFPIARGSYTRSAERADYVSGAFASTMHLPSDGLSCGACAAQWGWDGVGAAEDVCCSKPKPQRREAPPRTLRRRYATDASLNLTCGFDRGAPSPGASHALGQRRSLLAIVTHSNEADERYELRQLLRTAAPKLLPLGSSVGHTLQVCFVFDASPPRHVGGHRRPGQLYNTRAWLLYEAGRRADLDLTSLTADANYVPLAHVKDATKHWWLRAARHAQGPTPFDAYALTTISELRSANGMMTLRRPAWVARAAM